MSKLRFSFVLSGEGRTPRLFHFDTTPSDIARACRTAGIDCDLEQLERGESEYDSELWDRAHDEGDAVNAFATSGIVDARTGFALLDDLGVLFEDCETMGTLGGPLSPMGIVPDFAFTTESQLTVLSLRVTPFLEVNGEAHPVSKASWNRMRRLFRDGSYFRLGRNTKLAA